MRLISKYPEGWIDPDSAGGIAMLIGLFVFIIVVIATSYKDFDKD